MIAHAAECFLATLPCEKILLPITQSGDLSNPSLRFERRRCDLGVGPLHFVDETMVTEDNDFGVLIYDRFLRSGKWRRRNAGRS